MKSQIYNLIILDESGSMDCVRKQTISGCNETLNTIRAMQKKFEKTQDHFVSIFAFQSQGEIPSRYIIKNSPINTVDNISSDDYQPYGSTPLYDAIGSTIADLKVTTKSCEDAIGSVTIITDGYENSSTKYNLQQVAMMIEAQKELGWNFNFIGANIDVSKVSLTLNIDNVMAFEQSDEGTAEMFAKERSSREAYYSKLEEVDNEIGACISAIGSCEMTEKEIDELKERRRNLRQKASKGYFKS